MPKSSDEVRFSKASETLDAIELLVSSSLIDSEGESRIDVNRRNGELLAAIVEVFSNAPRVTQIFKKT